MTTTLHRVLQAFEEAQTTIRLDDLSRDLGIDPGTLDSMIQHWVRKGRIREIQGVSGGDQCHICGLGRQCPFVSRFPKRYAVIRSAGSAPAQTASAPVCRSAEVVDS